MQNGANLFYFHRCNCRNLFSNHPKNMDHVYKYIKDVVAVIITMVTNISRGDTMFYDGVNHQIWEIELTSKKNSHGRMIFGQFEIFFHGGSLQIEHRAVIYFIIKKQIFLHFFRHEDIFYNLYIYSTIRTKYLDDNGTGVKPNHFSQKQRRRNFSYSSRDQMWTIDIKKPKKLWNNKKTNWVYLSSWVPIP